MRIHDTLVAARALIETPATHAQKSYATDKDGYTVSATSEAACCRCAEGAVCSVLNISTSFVSPDESDDVRLAFSFLRNSATLLMKREGIEPRSGYHPDVDLNDGTIRLPGLTAHEAVLAMFDGAISSALEARI